MRFVQRLRAQRAEAGFTLVEVMVASLVLVTGFLAVASLFDLSKDTTVKTRARVNATNVARELAEAARAIPYADIADATVLDRIGAADSGLADNDPGAPHTIERRGVTYTITAETCVMDDNRDGGGAAPRSGDYCPESVAAGTKVNGKDDPIPEDYKRIDVFSTWDLAGRTATVKQTTIVNNPGSAGAPAILSLTGRSVPTPPVLGPTVSEVTFDVTTSSQPFAVKWMLDGFTEATVCSSCSGKAFSFTWQLDTPKVADDGPYLISAEAYDANSVSGPSRSTTIRLNRFQPGAPTGLEGGRNNGVVELEWIPNPERDLTGYTVTRDDGTTVCTLQLRTRCVDASPPDLATVRYTVTPWDVAMDGVTPRMSPNRTALDVIRDNQPPNGVDSTATKALNADGRSVDLRWTMPSPQDPDTGDSIKFFRVYRNGTAISDRYARVDAVSGITTYTFQDGDAAGDLSHRYYIVAVDQHFAESSFREAS